MVDFFKDSGTIYFTNGLSNLNEILQFFYVRFKSNYIDFGKEWFKFEIFIFPFSLKFCFLICG